MKIARIIFVVLLGLGVSGPASVFGQTKADVVSGSVPPTEVVQLTDDAVTRIPLRQLLFVGRATPFIVSPAAVGAQIEGVPVFSSLPVLRNSEPVAVDDSQATECYDWRNWKRPRYWGFVWEYQHHVAHDEDMLIGPDWETDSFVQAKGPAHYWWEPGKAQVVHLRCEEDAG